MPILHHLRKEGWHDAQLNKSNEIERVEGQVKEDLKCVLDGPSQHTNFAEEVHEGDDERLIWPNDGAVYFDEKEVVKNYDDVMGEGAEAKGSNEGML